MPTLVPIDAPLALILAIALGILAFHLCGATQNDGSRRALRWWDWPLLGIPMILSLFDGLASILGMGLILGALFRLSLSAVLRGERPLRFLIGPLATAAVVALPVYAFFAKYYRLGIPQRERRIQACLGLINDAQNLRQQRGLPYGSLPVLVEDGILEASGNAQGEGVVDGYALRLTIAPDGMGFQVVAAPLHYGNREVPLLALPYLGRFLPAPTGTRSFWMDQTGNLRGADIQGGAPKSQEEIRALPWIKRF